MRRARVLAALVLTVWASSAALPQSARDSMPLVFMRAGTYRELDSDVKVILALDFMRSFCGSLSMPTVSFIQCVDESTAKHPADKPIFDDLKTCTKKLS